MFSFPCVVVEAADQTPEALSVFVLFFWDFQ